MDAKFVLDMLVSRGLVERNQTEDITNEIKNSGKLVADILANYEIVDVETLHHMVAEELGTEYYDLKNFDPPEELLSTLPAGAARLYGAFPINISPEGLYVALTNPLDPQPVEDLRFALGKEIIPVVAKAAYVQQLIDTFYAGDAKDILQGVDVVGGDGAENINLDDLAKDANAAPIVRYVDLVLSQAIKEKASDVHFEPFENDFKIRYRVDGSLYEMAPPPYHLATPIISRLKVMANMNIAERRIPQDGRIMRTVGTQPVDMRVSSLPTQYGESVVLRILDRSSVNLDLAQLGLPTYISDYIDDIILKPNGIFIATGPTGAGKTTTLYACLRKINTIDSKLLTAEDPVEYDVDGIIQVPVNDTIGLSFSRILRAFLRQDPDKILVGEMRDVETAQIAIQASLTGHLVFSTLHTNDAPGAVTRLIDMGCEPFLVSATLEAVLAQRLLRTICAECRTSYEPNEAILSQLGVSPQELGDKSFYTGRGCEVCGETGYKGRQGLFELLDMSDPVRDLITEKAPAVVLRQKAIELGMSTLREDGLRNIYDGNTTIEEVLKYT